MKQKLNLWAADLSEWVRGLRFGGYTILFFVILLLGVASLSHTISVYVQQQQEIQAVKKTLQAAQESVAEQTAELENWQNQDFVKAQARDRLFYVMPGESQLGIIFDIEAPLTQATETSADLTAQKQVWTDNLIVSALLAGSAQP